MKRKPILITAAALALSAWPLGAQENAPVPSPQQNPPPHEERSRRPEADRPEAPRDPQARPQMREGNPRDDRFRRDGEPRHRSDRGPDQRRDDRSEPRHFDRPDRRDGPPHLQAGRGNDFRREGSPSPRRQGEHRERAEAEPRGSEHGPRFGPWGRGPGGDMRPPRIQQRRSEDRFAGGPGDSQFGPREFGMRRHHRGMKDNYGFAPRRGNDQDFRRGGYEMRGPMPPPHHASQDDRVGSDGGPGPGREEMHRRPPPNGPREMMRPRPDFEPRGREDRVRRHDFNGPRPGFDGPRPPMGPPPHDGRGPRPERPHPGGPPQQGWDEGPRRTI